MNPFLAQLAQRFQQHRQGFGGGGQQRDEAQGPWGHGQVTGRDQNASWERPAPDRGDPGRPGYNRSAAPPGQRGEGMGFQGWGGGQPGEQPGAQGQPGGIQMPMRPGFPMPGQLGQFGGWQGGVPGAQQNQLPPGVPGATPITAGTPGLPGQAPGGPALPLAGMGQPQAPMAALNIRPGWMQRFAPGGQLAPKPAVGANDGPDKENDNDPDDESGGGG
jgi:hypothetical protein